MTLLPCPECGAEVMNGKDTEKTVQYGSFTFQGKESIKTLPAKECPECGHVVAL